MRIAAAAGRDSSLMWLCYASCFFPSHVLRGESHVITFSILPSFLTYALSRLRTFKPFEIFDTSTGLRSCLCPRFEEVSLLSTLPGGVPTIRKPVVPAIVPTLIVAYCPHLPLVEVHVTSSCLVLIVHLRVHAT